MELIRQSTCTIGVGVYDGQKVGFWQFVVNACMVSAHAANAGLAQGDVIQEVAQSEVRTYDDFQEALGVNTDRPVFLRVYKPRQQQSVFIAVPR